MYRISCITYLVSHILYRIFCIAYYLVLHIWYCTSCIAYHVSHILYRISCVAYLVSHISCRISHIAYLASHLFEAMRFSGTIIVLSMGGAPTRTQHGVCSCPAVAPTSFLRLVELVAEQGLAASVKITSLGAASFAAQCDPEESRAAVFAPSHRDPRFAVQGMVGLAFAHELRFLLYQRM